MSFPAKSESEYCLPSIPLRLKSGAESPIRSVVNPSGRPLASTAKALALAIEMRSKVGARILMSLIGMDWQGSSSWWVDQDFLALRSKSGLFLYVHSSSMTPVLSPWDSAPMPVPLRRLSHRLHRGVFAFSITKWRPCFTPAAPPVIIVGQFFR